MVGGWVGGWFFQEILPLRGSIWQAGTCKILSLAKNPRWNRVWQKDSESYRGLVGDLFLSRYLAVTAAQEDHLSMRASVCA